MGHSGNDDDGQRSTPNQRPLPFEGEAAPPSGGGRPPTGGGRKSLQAFFHKPSGNPYAHAQEAEEVADQRPAASHNERRPLQSEAKVSSIRPTSKQDFRAGCRRIFTGYMPNHLRHRLRKEHRDFITRNESRPPLERTQILGALQRYDLGTTPGIRAQFNREDTLSLEEKLRRIEKDALENEDE